MHYKTLPIVLRTFDRISMFHSIESRAPFMDFKLAELAMQAERKHVVDRFGSKAPLRAILRKYNNLEAANYGKKEGFASDLQTLFESSNLRNEFISNLQLFLQREPSFKLRALNAISFLKKGVYNEAEFYQSSKLILISLYYQSKINYS